MTDSIPLGFGEFFCCLGVSGDIESPSVGDRGEPGLNDNSQGVAIGLTGPAIIKIIIQN